MTPVVSVVIPTKNRIDFLIEAVSSVLTQKIDELEIIVVNDGGRPVEDELSRHCDMVKVSVINNTLSVGRSEARNIGAAHSSGKYLACLDDDDMYLSGHLVACLEALEADVAEFVYGDALVSDVRGHDGTRAKVDQRHSYVFPYSEALLLAANFIPTSAAVCVNWRKFARFDPKIRVLEDWDLWLQLAHEHRYRFSRVVEGGFIYYRAPWHSSATTDADTNLAAFLDYPNTYELLMKRWSISSGPSDVYRDAMRQYFAAAIECLESGAVLPHLYYENILKELLLTQETGNVNGLGQRLAGKIWGEW
jgi:glycosyltransferase involved in cell wall biosynthesis